MFYAPVVANRYFDKHTKYDEVERDRNDLSKMIDSFERRIYGWYVEPIQFLFTHHDPGHFSFTYMAMTCLLIDALAQFEEGIPEATNRSFKDFVRRNMPSYCLNLMPSISHYRPGKSPTPLNDIADVLYHGFRCGILHEAHAPLYCGINPGMAPPRIEPTGGAKCGPDATNSSPGAACPVVIVFPEHAFAEVMTFFQGYLRNLKDGATQYDTLRNNFKKKFSDSFGIDISAATL